MKTFMKIKSSLYIRSIFYLSIAYAHEHIYIKKMKLKSQNITL